MKSETMFCNYGKAWWNATLFDFLVKREYWQNNSVHCKEGMKFIPTKSLTAIAFYMQWLNVDVQNQSYRRQDEETIYTNDDNKLIRKHAYSLKRYQLRKLVMNLRKNFSKAASHCHVKRVQEREFQNDLKDNIMRALQMDKLCLICVNYRKKLQVLYWPESVSIFPFVFFILSLSLKHWFFILTL